MGKRYHQCSSSSTGNKWELTPGFTGTTTNPSFSRLIAYNMLNPFNAVLETLYAGVGK
jgi:hypothetical protein